MGELALNNPVWVQEGESSPIRFYVLLRSDTAYVAINRQEQNSICPKTVEPSRQPRICASDEESNYETPSEGEMEPTIQSNPPPAAAKGKLESFEQLLSTVGEWGWYQRILLWFTLLPTCIHCALLVFSQTMMEHTPSHWCSVPQLNNLHIPIAEAKRLSIPAQNAGKDDSCAVYNMNFTLIYEHTHGNMSQLEPDFSWPIKPCTSGFHFNTSTNRPSIVEELGLVCEKQIFLPLGLTATTLGGLLGTLLFDSFIVRHGRRTTFLLCLVIEVIGMTAMSFANNEWYWMLTRFLIGLVVPTLNQIPFTLIVEICNGIDRVYVTTLTLLFHTAGLFLLGVFSYFSPNRLMLCFLIAVSLPLFGFVWWFLPESPRWLLTMTRSSEAAKVMQRMAKLNKRRLPDNFKYRIMNAMALQRQLITAAKMKKGRVRELYTTLLKRMSMLGFIWFVSASSYMGLTYYAPSVYINQYLSWFLSCSVDIVALVVSGVVLHLGGRKFPLVLALLTAGLSCLLTLMVPKRTKIGFLVCYLLGRCGVTSASLFLLPFTLDMFPADLRGVACRSLGFISGVGVACVPFLNMLGHVSVTLPVNCVGVVCVLGSIVTFLLPKTQGPSDAVHDSECSFTNCFPCSCISMEMGSLSHLAKSSTITNNLSRSSTDQHLIPMSSRNQSNNIRPPIEEDMMPFTRSHFKFFLRSSHGMHLPMDPTTATATLIYWH